MSSRLSINQLKSTFEKASGDQRAAVAGVISTPKTSWILCGLTQVDLGLSVCGLAGAVNVDEIRCDFRRLCECRCWSDGPEEQDAQWFHTPSEPKKSRSHRQALRWSEAPRWHLARLRKLPTRSPPSLSLSTTLTSIDLFANQSQ
jgi:hypothetical protein